MQKLFLFIIFTLAAGCTKTDYTMDTPPQFKQYKECDSFKMITANGVKLKAREVENYPKASLDFWTDASVGHLEKSGYTHKETTCFKTEKNLDGCTVQFVLPHGAQDWVYQKTIFVIEDTIILIEAAGEWDKFMAINKSLNSKLKTFNPNL